MAPKLYSYIVKYDTGLAPNPFLGYCTLALCTPNHMGISPEPGNSWIAGFSQKEYGNKLIYLMRVDEVMGFNQYYKDPRFEKKKPKVHGKWQEKVGDNMYYKNNLNKWEQHKTKYHRSEAEIEKDLRLKDRKHRSPMVFISEHYFYFGEKAIDLPDEFKKLIYKTRGIKCGHDNDLVISFLEWIHRTYSPGIIGLPRDRKKIIC